MRNFCSRVRSLVLGLACVAAACSAAPAQVSVEERWAVGTAQPPDQGLVSENPRVLAIDDAGTVYATGEQIVGPNQRAIAIWKFNADGTVASGWPFLWSSEMLGLHTGVAITVTPAITLNPGQPNAQPHGRSILVAGVAPGMSADADMVIIRLREDGNLQWATRFDGYGLDDVPTALDFDPQGNAYVAGRSGTPGAGFDYFIGRFDFLTGVLTHSAKFGGPGKGDDSPCCISVSKDGGGSSGSGPARVWVTGYATHESSRAKDYATLAYTYELGTPVWGPVYYYNPANPVEPGDPNGQSATSSGDDVATAMSSDGSRLYITGYSEGRGTSYDYATHAYSASSGAALWPQAARYDGPAHGKDIPRAIDSGLAAFQDVKLVYVTGSSLGTDGTLDMTTIAYNSGAAVPSQGGTQVYIDRYMRDPGSPGDEVGLGIQSNFADSNPHVYVTGTSSNGANSDVTTIRYGLILDPPGPSDNTWVIHFPELADGLADMPMSLAFATNAATGPGFPFVLVASRSPDADWISRFPLTIIKYRQCPGAAPCPE